VRCRTGAGSQLTLGLFESRQGLVDIADAILDLVELFLLVGGEQPGFVPVIAAALALSASKASSCSLRCLSSALI
jgi:hypothetical protein